MQSKVTCFDRVSQSQRSFNNYLRDSNNVVYTVADDLDFFENPETFNYKFTCSTRLRFVPIDSFESNSMMYMRLNLGNQTILIDESSYLHLNLKWNQIFVFRYFPVHDFNGRVFFTFDGKPHIKYINGEVLWTVDAYTLKNYKSLPFESPTQTNISPYQRTRFDSDATLDYDDNYDQEYDLDDFVSSELDNLD